MHHRASVSHMSHIRRLADVKNFNFTVQLLDRIKEGGLLEAFLDRDARFAPVLKDIPLIVVTNDQLGLLGARQYALKLLDPANDEVSRTAERTAGGSADVLLAHGDAL